MVLSRKLILHAQIMGDLKYSFLWKKIHHKSKRNKNWVRDFVCTYKITIFKHRPVIIDLPDEKLNINSKSFENVLECFVYLDDRKSHFATCFNEWNIMEIII